MTQGELLQPADPKNPLRSPQMWRMTELLLGLGLLAVGTARRSLLGLLVAAVGVTLGVNSLRRWHKARSTDNAGKRHGMVSNPSSQCSEVWDQVDEASWESFPGSDPPAFYSRNG